MGRDCHGVGGVAERRGQVPGSLVSEAPCASGEGFSFCTLAEDFGRSFLQRRWILQSVVHPGSDNGQSAGLGQER